MIRSLLLPLVLVSGTAFANPADDATATAEPAPAKAPATAPTQDTKKAQMFEDLDANKDGSLEQSEITKVEKLGEQFATVDTDKNGKLSKAEYQAWTEKVAEKR
jgi:hypothetical protein